MKTYVAPSVTIIDLQVEDAVMLANSRLDASVQDFGTGPSGVQEGTNQKSGPDESSDLGW
ncbi:MAG: hypothetical protein HUK09_02905 [Bacteroidaceae bacterium]|nr:hypothetical protein [Bacteroidaceae bacterium]